MPVLSDALSFARTQAQTDSNGLTNANGVIWGNEALVDFRRRLIAAGIDAAQLQESYRDGTANVGRYLYPTNMFWLKEIEVNYAGTNADGYIAATQLDVANIPGNRSIGWIRANASTAHPYFDDHGDEFEIFPTPTAAHNITSLIRIFYFLEPTEYTAVGDTIAYPESLDYRTLGWRIASNYLYSLGKVDDGVAFNLKYEERIKQIISTLSRGSQQPIQSTPLSMTGFEF